MLCEQIDYEIVCFDRMLSVIVPCAQADEARRILDEAYTDWNEDDAGWCCEEFMVTQLEAAEISYSVVEA